MPKSGTHLLASLLDEAQPMRFAGRLVAFDSADALAPEARLAELDRTLRLLRPSHYVGAHLMRHAEVETRLAASGATLLTILRDPRAVVLSGAHYVLDAPQLRGRERALELFPDLESLLSAMVRGHGEPGDDMYFPEIGERYRAYAGWADAPIGLTVRFEDLIGAKGGGDQSAQLQEVRRILVHLDRDPQRADAIAERLFSENAITFRSGAIESWRRELDPGLAAEIAERCSDSMDRLGYQG